MLDVHSSAIGDEICARMMDLVLRLLAARATYGGVLISMGGLSRFMEKARVKAIDDAIVYPAVPAAGGLVSSPATSLCLLERL